jgi:CheY-like chemotaxis protein
MFYMLFKSFLQQVDNHFETEQIDGYLERYSPTVPENKELPQLIIIDARISGISPIDLLNQLRVDLRFTMPIWFVTQIGADLYLEKIMDVGANRIIFIPFDPLKLANEIVELINFKRSLA